MGHTHLPTGQPPPYPQGHTSALPGEAQQLKQRLQRRNRRHVGVHAVPRPVRALAAQSCGGSRVDVQLGQRQEVGPPAQPGGGRQGALECARLHTWLAGTGPGQAGHAPPRPALT